MTSLPPYRRRLVLVACLALAAASAQPALAQGKATPDPSPLLKQERAMHFPQPVRVGDLPGRKVIFRGTHLTRIASVVGVFRPGSGALDLVVRYGGAFGLGGRMIAPPLGATRLVGPMVMIADLDRRNLDALPTFDARGGAFLRPNETIRVGVDRNY